MQSRERSRRHRAGSAASRSRRWCSLRATCCRRYRGKSRPATHPPATRRLAVPAPPALRPSTPPEDCGARPLTPYTRRGRRADRLPWTGCSLRSCPAPVQDALEAGVVRLVDGMLTAVVSGAGTELIIAIPSERRFGSAPRWGKGAAAPPIGADGATGSTATSLSASSTVSARTAARYRPGCCCSEQGVVRVVPRLCRAAVGGPASSSAPVMVFGSLIVGPSSKRQAAARTGESSFERFPQGPIVAGTTASGTESTSAVASGDEIVFSCHPPTSPAKR